MIARAPVYRVRVLLKATLSRLRQQCGGASSRSKREADDEELQHLNNDLMTQAVHAGRNDIEQVSVGIPILHIAVTEMRFLLSSCHLLSLLTTDRINLCTKRYRKCHKPEPVDMLLCCISER